jgi:site-specific DNA recombinase
MLELSWGGLKAHTGQGYNIGKPPYGYLAEKLRHPVKAKAHEGKTKHRLVPDPVRGPVVTQIFLWRAVNRLSYDEIAGRLNRDPDRYPPPDPILGEGRRRIGAWTTSSVREVLDNPKHTGYMVWESPHARPPGTGRQGPGQPAQRLGVVASAHPQPLVTREIFAAASSVGRFLQGSRSGPGTNRHPETRRTYLLRSYVRCDLCNRRAWGCTTKGYTYYRCRPNAKNHAHLSWFADHPPAAMVAEDQLIAPLARFFGQRVFGAGRKSYLAAATAAPPPPATSRWPRARRSSPRGSTTSIAARRT